MGNTDYLIGAEKWAGLKSIGMVESERQVSGEVSRFTAILHSQHRE